MKNLLCLSLITFCLSQAQAANEVSVAAQRLYISPSSDSGGDGSQEHPLGSFDEVKPILDNLLRNRAPLGGVEVIFQKGIHHLAKPIVLGYQLSFPEFSHLTLRGEGNTEDTILDLGTSLSVEDLQRPIREDILKRSAPQAREHLRMIDLKAMGIEHETLPDCFADLDGGAPELYQNGQRLPLSRYPNQGTMHMGQVIDNGTWYGAHRQPGIFEYTDSRHEKWGEDALAAGMWFNGFWRIPWQSWTVKISNIEPQTKQVAHKVSVGNGSPSGPYGGIGSKFARLDGKKGSGEEPYTALNILEEIDEPGEWCIDYRDNILYLWPLSKDGDLTISHNKDAILQLNGVSNIKLKNLKFQHGRGNGIEMIGGNDNSIEECNFEKLGGWGAIIRGGYRNGVKFSKFQNLGKGGIELSGGDTISLTPCHNYANHNELFDLAHLQTTWAPAIQIGRGQMHGGSAGLREAVGIRVDHNHIYNLPHSAILYGGCLNEIADNEIHHIAKITEDVGYIYTRHDWTSRGNKILRNVLYGSPHANGIYIDDGDSGDTVLNNTIKGANFGIVIGGGRDNHIENNTLMECKVGIFYDNRGVARGYDEKSEARKSELKVPELGRDAWQKIFPEVFEILNHHPQLPVGNHIQNNLFSQCKENIRATNYDKGQDMDYKQWMIIENNRDLGDALK
jgi:parallel beta-helix repeat protein